MEILNRLIPPYTEYIGYDAPPPTNPLKSNYTDILTPQLLPASSAHDISSEDHIPMSDSGFWFIMP